MSITKKSLLLIIILLYIIPTFIQANYSETNTIEGVYVGLPIMQSGDEPHYYLTLYSLVNDGDVFLTNNYDNAIYNDGPDAGSKKLTPYDRHSRFFDSVNRNIISIPMVDGLRDLSYTTEVDSYIKEIPGHPLGLPFFAYMFLFPFKNTSILEHIAIFLTFVFSLLGILVFYKLMLFYHNNKKIAILFTGLFALATQYWYYSKTFWAEPYLASFLIISWYLIVSKKSLFAYIVSGILLGFGFLIKLPFLLLIFPFYIYLLHSYITKTINLKQGIVFSIPITTSLLGVLCLNYYFTKNPFMFDKMDSLGFILPFRPLTNWFFSLRFGLFVFSPVLLFAFLGIKRFWKKYSIHCLCLGLMMGLYILFWTTHNSDMALGGGGGYSGRYLVPIVPLFAVFCSFYNKVNYNKYLFYILLGISFFINITAAFAYPTFIDTSIVSSFEKIIGFLLG